MKTIAFYSPHLSERGTEVAMYDYAHYNEKILGNKSIIIYHDKCTKNNITAIEKFKNRFEVFEISGPNYDFGWNAEIIVPLIDKIILEQKCDVLYMQKGGKNDGVYSKICKNLILCCSNYCEPHGDAYVYVSKWLSETNSNGKIPWIPIIIDLPVPNHNFRNELSIPEDAIVFGRTGGVDTWNIPWASKCVEISLEKNQNIYFIFQNTPKFLEHPRVKYIKTTVDSQYKSNFINACDAMLHCRAEGESFGQACAEFSVMNKQIITWFGSFERNHINTLQEKGIYYNNELDLVRILTTYKPTKRKDFNCYKNHKPEIAMEIFKKLLNKVI